MAPHSVLFPFGRFVTFDIFDSEAFSFFSIVFDEFLFISIIFKFDKNNFLKLCVIFKAFSLLLFIKLIGSLWNGKFHQVAKEILVIRITNLFYHDFILR